MEIDMAYKAQPLTEERLIKAKEMVANFERSGIVPQRARYYLADLIAEVERAHAEIKQLREKSIEHSWRLNPDRSGGQFSDREILNSYRKRW
jgi:hypothetical protein